MTGNKFVYAGLIAILSFSLLAMPAAGTSAEERYTFVTMWPKLPQPWYFDNPSGIAVDSSGCVYVADSWNVKIQKFAPKLALVNPPSMPPPEPSKSTFCQDCIGIHAHLQNCSQLTVIK